MPFHNIRNCVEQCEKTGQIGDISFKHCQYSSDGFPVDGSWYMQEPLYVRWKQWNCKSDCRYHCTMRRESEREKLGLEPVKYYGKWPFKRVSVFQEPVSAVFSALNLVMHFNGWLSFFLLLHYKLPLRPQSRRTYYEYTGLWHIYGLLAMNAWFWSAIFHSRSFDLTEKLDCSASIALLGYSLILSILRTINVKDESSRVMVAAPLLAFVTTHILYLNFYELDHGLNMKVRMGMQIAQLLLWTIWVGVTHHPSRFKLWAVVLGSGLLILKQSGGRTLLQRTPSLIAKSSSLFTSFFLRLCALHISRMAEPTRWLLALFMSLGWLVGTLDASAGDADPLYRNCVEQCERTGQIGDLLSSQHCLFLSQDHGAPPGGSDWYMRAQQLYMRWRQWNCKSDCRRECVSQRESERQKLGLEPVKYHGKWPHRRADFFQEGIATALPAINLMVQLHGWLSFSRLLPHKLALNKPMGRRSYYEYTGLWHVYALLAANAWFWSTICHSREFELTEQMVYSSAVALVGYSLILSIARTFNLRDEASRVMVASPVLGFLMTHICYLNFADLDYVFNMKVCNVMGVAQLLMWVIWAGVTRHPSRFKLWTVGFGGALAMVLEAYDFPPYKGYFDAHTLWHATTVPVTYLWWSFVRDDAEFRISALMEKAK
ncbi:hypothetical protein Taro_025735 [Colocasia esculenta]|uniref:Post-GPI attachment to proteins factor 3 n=1 Tax=Colocasia esculenta TaxID=4460 RepID=A0A843VF36_COLES|nr:hypothetical protein [Colocasia esculenta]